MHPLVPSGRQSTIEAGDQQLTVVEVGGGIRCYKVSGEDVLDGYAIGETCSSGRGQVLAPWPNRLAQGRYNFAGEDNQTALTEPSKGNAIHGLVRFANWVVAEQAPDQVTMAHRLHPHPGYPYLLDLQVNYALGSQGLTVTVVATNRGSGPAPFGYGAHPYLRIGDGVIDDLLLEAPGASRYLTDDSGIPTGTEPVAGGPYDLREARVVGDTQLDTGYSDLARDDTGRATVRLVEAAGPRRISLWLERSCPYLMLFTGDSLPDASRRRRGLGVEPMTCAPNALRSGDGLITLAPGESTTARWGITAEGFGG